MSCGPLTELGSATNQANCQAPNVIWAQIQIYSHMTLSVTLIRVVTNMEQWSTNSGFFPTSSNFLGPFSGIGISGWKKLGSTKHSRCNCASTSPNAVSMAESFALMCFPSSMYFGFSSAVISEKKAH
jgi:hypothetical protein